jgi:hypothetical protein
MIHITPPCGLFLTCTGEKYIQNYTTTYVDSTRTYVLTPVNGVRTSLHSGPMLETDCPDSHKLLASPLPKAALFSTPHAYTCNTISAMEDDIGTSEVFSIRHSFNHNVNNIFE